MILQDYHLRYPIGEFVLGKTYTQVETNDHISNIESFPSKLLDFLVTFPADQLAKPYRPGGWTGNQVIHHLADSHMNALLRLKLALTEDNPTIKPYPEQKFAELADYVSDKVAFSMILLYAIHTKWAILLNSISESDWSRSFYHPSSDYTYTIQESTAQYAWHCDHHFAHLKLLAV